MSKPTAPRQGVNAAPAGLMSVGAHWPAICQENRVRRTQRRMDGGRAVVRRSCGPASEHSTIRRVRRRARERLSARLRMRETASWLCCFGSSGWPETDRQAPGGGWATGSDDAGRRAAQTEAATGSTWSFRLNLSGSFHAGSLRVPQGAAAYARSGGSFRFIP